jgi:ribosomal-protein-serine acetyltransferase
MADEPAAVGAVAETGGPLTAGDYLLRPFVPADAADFAAAVNESTATVGRWMSWAHAGYSEADALLWFQSCDASRAAGAAHEFGLFGASDGAFVGGAGLNQFNAANGYCNLGYWVRQSAQRRGAALAAIACLAPLAFGALAQTRVEIVVAVGNEPSLAVARRAGAVHEGIARNRLRLHGLPVDAHLLALLPPA